MGARGSVCQNGPTCGPKGPTPMCKCMLMAVTVCNGRTRASPVKSGVDPVNMSPCKDHTREGAPVERDSALSSLGEFLLVSGT